MASGCEEVWTLVTNRRRNGGRTRRTIEQARQKMETLNQPWTPVDTEIDSQGESKLMEKMQNSMKKVRGSEFYNRFLGQLESPLLSANFPRVLGSTSKLGMVVYGIGSIEASEMSRLQLSLAILLRENLDCIDGMEIFDPIISSIEVKVMERFGCSFISINEMGRREVMKPTLFFMPHCDAFMYDNLLAANWKPVNLNRIVLFGNSFEKYESAITVFRSKVADALKYVMGIRKYAMEFLIETCSEDFFYAFHSISWHFFDLDPLMDLRILDL
ncbi:hypothetical protein AMTRI_Chr02g255800 [Amborella trichopoda]|uniref:SRR1-like domain-containing protein n=1 Tax=Amborella trichopoda TaxID=13333 RepID=U5CNZ7_AMBTC|nr:protein SENSITIVITY TO RED LIGHT REDUCED 1 [Amborella trichopoda]ERN14891.1 hypothetical protein AMTR_s00032p00165380 [Amborella trichopoda]|eukprot:XP_006853424.1 protein SENSITIVITY TO RED LIGHT REDUCED 1 [Amborella trichopoda]